jgi:hypothetical protein
MRCWHGGSGRSTPFCPVIYLDAIRVRVCAGAYVINKAAHIAIDVDGLKHVLVIRLRTANPRGVEGVRGVRAGGTSIHAW